ncbi:MAG: porin family protein [Candidatus Tokpelaia sp.]|uniref:outer membrane protein n=1 Tax=Candidatus Tokpelaia sp. TaxID=2233777 RepID=UPI001239B2D1|nr:outer membrane beta-barrel protein [Candidatus Tokpelaia sp.]KAA6205477.1 MAG: porin family protein [Candidatus Tokpelaia sp.]KAA6206784.1 MAG: porin family protein [Candidatus Tokpelaia sp.]KAA6406335.1 hypothetical protein DPQ22_00015 [Candidatus Tokpelaia sp.]
MKKSIIAAGVLALLASTGAKAADIVTYQDQAVAAPSGVNWTGFYVGGTIGGAWAESKTRLRGPMEISEGGDKDSWGRIAKKTVNPDSFIGGIYAGYNFEIGALANTPFLKDVVFGVETDFLFNSGNDRGGKDIDQEYVDFNSSANGRSWYLGEGADGARYKVRVKQKWNGATRFRAGYALGNEGRFMPYFATGISYANIQAKGAVLSYSTATGDRNYINEVGHHSMTKTRAGWNIGGGVDYVPPIMNDHLVLRAEYRFTDFGRDDYNVKDLNGNKKYNQVVKYYTNDFRVGVAYKF